jgi:hypothetical protein
LDGAFELVLSLSIIAEAESVRRRRHMGAFLPGCRFLNYLPFAPRRKNPLPLLVFAYLISLVREKLVVVADLTVEWERQELTWLRFNTGL